MEPTEDERVMAALSHASIVANVANMAGLIGAALIWITQREKSAYVRAQALQALAYQGCVLLVALLLLLGWGGCLGLSLLPAAMRPELYDSSLPALFWLVLYLGLVPLLFALVAIAYALFAAVQAYRGQPFRYVLVGRVGNPPPVRAVPAPVAVPAPAPAAAPAPVAAPSPEATAPAPAPPTPAAETPDMTAPATIAPPAAEPSGAPAPAATAEVPAPAADTPAVSNTEAAPPETYTTTSPARTEPTD